MEQPPVQIGQYVLGKNLGIGAFGKVRMTSNEPSIVLALEWLRGSCGFYGCPARMPWIYIYLLQVCWAYWTHMPIAIKRFNPYHMSWWCMRCQGDFSAHNYIISCAIHDLIDTSLIENWYIISSISPLRSNLQRIRSQVTRSLRRS